MCVYTKVSVCSMRRVPGRDYMSLVFIQVLLNPGIEAREDIFASIWKTNFKNLSLDGCQRDLSFCALIPSQSAREIYPVRSEQLKQKEWGHKSTRGEQEKEYTVIFAAFDVFQDNVKDIFSQSFPWSGIFLINFYNGFKAGLFS